MTFDEGRDAILAVFKTAWDTLGLPVTYTDVPAATPDGKKVWARVKVEHTAGRQSSLTGADGGTKRYTNKGILWVQVFAPVGDGSTAGYVASQAVVNAYRDARISVLFRNVRMNDAGDDGAFTRFDVKADFEYDDVR